MNKRTSGVLAHLSSLPSPFAVGVMGKEAREFIDKISAMGFSCWQVLPLTIVDMSSSPYCSPSAFAGECAFIDPRLLANDGLISETDLNSCRFEFSPFQANFEKAREGIRNVLRLALERSNGRFNDTLELFATQQPWVKDYALYSVLKEKNSFKPWFEWEKADADYCSAISCVDKYSKELNFYIFEQYVFYSQWRSLKEYANSKGISILGDMPIYVSADSVDVWANTEQFCIDPVSLKLSEVAGVPPDYFSENGQLWGNPLYDWDAMKSDGYNWWIERISHSLRLFDRLRIDHFRAFASYWAVPADAETAKTGQWKIGPGMKLFNAIKANLGECDIIAEDLGIFGKDVVQLLEESGFPGMRVIQFGFAPGANSTHLPHNYVPNTVAYVGTHDNNTALGWLWAADKTERAFALRYCSFAGGNWGEGGAHSQSVRSIIEAVWRSAANTAIVSIQDMAGYGEDARMNRPGTAEGNWTFRTTQSELNKLDENYFKEINAIFSR